MIANTVRSLGLIALATIVFAALALTASPATAKSGTEISWSPRTSVEEGDTSFVSGSFESKCKKRVVKLLKLEDGAWMVIGRIVLKAKFTDFSFTFYHSEPGQESYSLSTKARPKCGPMASSTATYTVE